MGKTTKGIVLSCPKQDILFSATTIGYIDDNNIVITHDHHTPIDHIAQASQKSLSTWNGLLEATGGILSENKTSMYIWEWYW